MKIAIVVQGRFHAFDLARDLLKRGNDVTIFTNYPAWAIKPFGVPADRVRSFVFHGILSRVSDRVRSWTGWSWESWTHPMFSSWADRSLKTQSWDVIHAWSGVAAEIYKDAAFSDSLRLIMRGSAHIRTQARLLAEEQARVGCAVNHPDRWIIEREEREYEMATAIVVLSGFAHDSFVAEGFPRDRLRFLPLGAETGTFRPAPEVVEARRSRILSGAPLRVLYVGGVSWRKGLFDLIEIVKGGSGRFQFRFVGPIWKEAASHLGDLAQKADFIPKRPQGELPQEYGWGDVFIFPTIEDGFAVVLAQASAAALPILTTTNCCGPDLVHEGRTGWVLPIRNAGAFVERLYWCDSHRMELAEMVSLAYTEFRTRDWSDVASDFETMCLAEIDAQRRVVSHD